MIIGIISFKGGVGKTTAAVHLAHSLNVKEPTALIDGDLNRSALAWLKRGEDRLPFKVFPEKQAAKVARDFNSLVFDTGARPSNDELKDLAEGCDKLVLVTSPDAMALDALLPAVDTLVKLKIENYRILLTLVPPVGNAGADARDAIVEAKLPIYRAGIRRFAAFQKASLRGVTVDLINDPYAREAWSDCSSFAKEVLK